MKNAAKILKYKQLACIKDIIHLLFSTLLTLRGVISACYLS
nr:MAG TPA: hypothetical protein [Microviridae sp.]